MTVGLAQTIWLWLAAYLAIGAAFSLYFVSRGAARIDDAAKGANFWFRLFLFPGAALLWPGLLVRVLTLRKRKT